MAPTVVACMHEIINCIHYWFSCLFACGGSVSFMEYCHVGSNESGKAHRGLFYGHFHRTQVNLSYLKSPSHTVGRPYAYYRMRRGLQIG